MACLALFCTLTGERLKIKSLSPAPILRYDFFLILDSVTGVKCLLLFSSVEMRSFMWKVAWVTSDPYRLCSRAGLGLECGVWAAAGVCGRHVGEDTEHSEPERPGAGSKEPPTCSYTGNNER